MLLRNRRLGCTNNHYPGLHYLQLTLSPRNFLIETFKLYVRYERYIQITKSFFQQLDKKCFKRDAKEKLIRMETSGCFFIDTCKERRILRLKILGQQL